MNTFTFSLIILFFILPIVAFLGLILLRFIFSSHFLFSSLLSHPCHSPLDTHRTPLTVLPRFPSPLGHLAVLVPPYFSLSRHS